MCMDAQMPWSTGCARAACHEDLHRDVLMGRSAGMRASRFVSPFPVGVHCAALSCFAQAQGIHPWTPGGAKHASLKGTAEPLCPGSSRHDSFTFSGSHQGAMDNWLQFFSC